jgi:hypothetical protein
VSDALNDAGNFIEGSNDPSTMDSRGLTQADRRQGMFSGLTQLGATLLAAGQPMYGPDRARILSQLGNVPAAIQNTEVGRQQQQMLGMKNQQAQMQMKQMAQMRSVLQSPEFQQKLAGLDPSTAALLKAAAAGGDMATVAKIYDSMQPKMSYSGVVFDPRRGLVIDPFTGTRMSLNGPQGGQGTPQTPGNALFQFQRTPGLDPDATDTKLLGSLPPMMRANVESWLQGKLPVPTSSAMKDPRIQQQLALAHTIDPSFDAANYPTRLKIMKDLTSGTPFNNVIAPARKFLNHGATYLQTWDQMGLDDGPKSFVTNPLKVAKLQAQRNGLVDAAQTNLQTMKTEYEKFMGGKGQLTDLARKMENDLSLSGSASQQREVIGKMVQLMQGQLDPYVEQRKQVLGKSGYMSSDLLDDMSRKSLQYVQNWHPAQEGGAAAPAEGGAAAPAEGAQPQAASPAEGAQPQAASPTQLPPTTMYEFRRNPQTGKLQRRLRQGAMTDGR